MNCVPPQQEAQHRLGCTGTDVLAVRYEVSPALLCHWLPAAELPAIGAVNQCSSGLPGRLPLPLLVALLREQR
jgi:hypothetical protein